MHTMLWSHEALRGSMRSPSSRRCTCTHCFENSFKRKHPYGSTIKCAQCYGAIRPSVAPCALQVQDAVQVSIVFKLIRKKGFLRVDHKMHAMLWSHEALCGSMCSLTSSRCTCTHCFGKLVEKKAPLWVDHKMHTMLWSHEALRGSMCSPSSRRRAYTCYGAIKPSVAPWLLHAPDPISIILRFTQKRKSLWVNHKLHKIHTMSCSHQALRGSWCSPPSMRCTHCLEMHSKPSTPMGRQ